MDSILYVRHSFDDVSGLKCPKGKKTREIAISTAFAQELIDYAHTNPNWEQTHRVFYSHKGNANLANNYYRKHLYQGYRAIGISEEERERRNLCFHSLRHTFITLMRGHIDDEILRLSVGHTDRRITDGYTGENVDTLLELGQTTSRVFGDLQGI